MSEIECPTCKGFGKIKPRKSLDRERTEKIKLAKKYKAQGYSYRQIRDLIGVGSESTARLFVVKY